MRRLLRLLLFALLYPPLRLVYRLRCDGRQNIPGGAYLLISNHVSYVDALVLGAVVGPELRFVMWRHFYRKPLLNWFCRIFDAIPIDPADPPQEVRRSLDAVSDALREGRPVAMFPEGQMTRTGHVHAFRRGFELAARRVHAPIVPAYIDGLWGSIFSYEGGRILWKWPRRFRRRVTVCIGAPLAPETSSVGARRAVVELGVRAYAMRKAHQRPLHCEFWRAARRMGRRTLMADGTGVVLSGWRTLAGALAVARWMRHRCAGESNVGMMMPASCSAALVNAAALICGKTPINLNFTGARSHLDDAVVRCRLKTIFTSRQFLQRISMEPRPEFVYLEDVMAALTRWERFLCLVIALVTPGWLADRLLLHRSRMDDLATVMFTSGSTGRPKGVMLSHHNVVSNIEAMAEVFQFSRRDAIMGVLPPFHAFGFTVTVWIPLYLGVRVVYHSNPLDAKGVGQLVAKHRATILLGTPTFFSLYARGCPPEDFRSLRLAISGAQKLAPAVAEAFERHFGLPISEGYGCTELSPVVSVNVADVEIGGVRQSGWRRGSVGRLLPGLAARIVDRDTLEPLAEDAVGVVQISGPSVMIGYLDDPHATAEVLRDGWYVTADLGSLDEDGFLYIHDRVARFSKIGGEMVAHAAVENALHEAEGSVSRNFAVLSFADVSRGERLVVLYDGPDLDVEALRDRMLRAGVPRLWIPSPRDFHRVESVPILPSGKLDLATARRLAQELCERNAIQPRVDGRCAEALNPASPAHRDAPTPPPPDRSAASSCPPRGERGDPCSPGSPR